MRHLIAVMLFCLLLPTVTLCQDVRIFRNSTLSYSELAGILNVPQWDTIVFEDVTFRDDREGQIWQDSLWGNFMTAEPISLGKLNSLQFTGCSFSTNILFEGEIEGEMSFEDCKGPQALILRDCNITGLWISNSDVEIIRVHHSAFKDLIIDTDNHQTTVGVTKTTVQDGILEITANRVRVEESRFFLAKESLIESPGEGNPWTYLENCVFESADSVFMTFEQTGGQIQLLRSTFNGGVALVGDGDRITWNLVDNNFGSTISIDLMAEIGPASYLGFAEVYRQRPLGFRYTTKEEQEIFFDGSGDQIGDDRRYSMLLRLHKMFHDFYLKGGDIQTANFLYTRIKDLETRHLQHRNRQSPSFDLSIRIGLNKLLKFYTRYGTDPARAIIISIWVIFGFGLFYLFFPSSWDVTSKSKLLRDFSNLKNVSSGRYRTFIGLLTSATIAFLNAITLSLNSFVTLGFGEIPTRGVARYVTIAEGFLGWFLLTLFSVALISQSSF
jgi:hypothetical protein